MKKLKLLFFMLVALCLTNISYAQLDEDFNATTIPAGWSNEHVTNTTDWVYETGGSNSNGPGAAHSGAYNALFDGSASHRTKLITPELDLSVGSGEYELKFWYALPNFLGSTGDLRIYYKAASADAWSSAILELTAAQEGWTEVTIDLTFESSTYYIAFEGDGGGWGVCLDDVTVTEKLPDQPTALNIASSGSGFVNLAWTAPVSYTPASYSVYRNGTAIATGVAGTTYNDNTILDDKIYSYYVTAYKVAVESYPSNIVYENINGKITPPLYESFEIVDANYPHAPYAWESNVTTGQATDHWKQAQGGPSSLPPSAQDGNYNLVAKDISSSSYGYKTHLITPTFDLTGIAELKITFHGFSHHLMSGNETSIYLKYNNDGGGTWVDIDNWELNSQWNEYEIVLDAATHGFPAATDDNYRLSFYSQNNGNMGISTVLDNITIVAYFDEPENLLVTDESSGNVSLSWDDLPAETGYKIFRRDQATPDTWTELATVGTSITSYNDGTVTDHTPYEYCITAIYGTNESPKTDLVVGVPASLSLVPFYLESFEYGGDRAVGWINEHEWKTRDWRCQKGGGVYYDSPPTAYDGDYNVMFAKAYDMASDITKYVTPRFDLVTGGPYVAELTFRYSAFEHGSDGTGTMKLYYKNTFDGAWIELESYVNSANWEEKKVILPNLSTSYWLAFEGNVKYDEGIALDYVKVVVSPPMTYVSSNVTQYKTKMLDIDTDDNEMIAVKVTTGGGQTNPLNITQFNFDTNGDNGSNNPTTNITKAKLYYNPDGAVFNPVTAVYYGSKTSPNGAFTISGTQELAFEENYFFLCYNVPADANLDEYLDAKCTQITMDGIGGTQTPTTTNPVGSRQIKDLAIISIAGGTSDNGGYGPLTPSNHDNDYAKYSYLFTAEELYNAGLPNGAEITQVQWNKSDGTQIASQGDAILDVYMKNTTNTVLIDATDWATGVINGATQVINNQIINTTFNLPNTAGWVGFDLNNSTFMHNGNALEVSVAWDKSGVASPFSTSPLQWVYYTDKTNMILEENNETEAGTHTLNTYNYRPNIQIEYAKKPMVFVSATTTQNIGVEVGTDQHVIGIQIEMEGEIIPENITKFTLNALNSDNIDDFHNAKIFYTGANPEFLTTTQFGTTYAAPNTGNYEIIGDQELISGTNYFWVTYDIKPTAVLGNYVDAESVSFVIGGGTENASPTAPTGKTQIGVFETIEFGPELTNGSGNNDNWGPIFRASQTATSDYSRYAYVYTQTELEAKGMPNDVRIIDVQWNKANTGQMQDGTGYFKVYANNSTKTTLPEGTNWPTDVIPGATEVVNKTFNSTYNLPGTAGWIRFPFTSEFVYGGEGLELATQWDASEPDVTNVTTGEIIWAYSYHTNEHTTVGKTGSNTAFWDDLDNPNDGFRCRPDLKITYLALPMSYVSSTCEQLSTFVGKGETEEQIIRIAVTTQNTYDPLSATKFALNVNGTTNAAVDITNAKLFYTGTSDLFDNSTQFGSTVGSPTGNFNITGTQALEVGVNYFWLTYDIPAGATEGNFVDAQCTEMTLSTTDYTPSIISPAGQAKIVNILQIGAGTAESTNYGPILWTNTNVSDYARWSYIFTQAELNSIPNGAEIAAVQWYKNNANNIDYPGNTYLDLYLRGSIETDWANLADGSGWINWATQVIAGSSTSVKVLDGTFNETNNFPAYAGWTTFEFDANHIYDNTKGLEIACDWDYTEIESNSKPDDKIQWRYTSGLSSNMTAGWIGNGAVPTKLKANSYGGTVRPNTRILYYTPQAKQYSSSAAFQATTIQLTKSDTERKILGVEVVILGETGSDVDITELIFNTTGTTNANTDIANAKLFYTGSNNFYGNGVQVGSTIASINGAFTFNGFTQSLGEGSHYFWLTFDVKSGATYENFVDAQFTSITANTVNKTPTTTNPDGKRRIKEMKTVTLGTATSSNTNLGPFYRKTPTNTNYYSKYNYLFTAAELAVVNGLPNGAKITRLQWKKNGTGKINSAGTGSMEVYLKNSNKTVFPIGSESWTNVTDGTTLMQTSYFDEIYNNIVGNNEWMEVEFNEVIVYNGDALEIATKNDFSEVTVDANLKWYFTDINTSVARGMFHTTESNTNTLKTIKHKDASNNEGERRPNLIITYVVPNAPPVLTAADPVTVDADFDITYPDDSDWRAKVYKVTYGTNTLPSSAYTLTAGVLTLKPSQAACLQIAGTETVTVYAKHYASTSCVQPIGHGVATQAGIKTGTQPVGPLTNGAVLETQPVVEIQDQYNNPCTSDNTSTITATKEDAGNWTLGGTIGATTVTAGAINYADLTATSLAGEITTCQIRFTVSPSTAFVVSDLFTVSYGTPNLWAGVISEDWHTPINWDDNKVPAADQDIIIENGATFYPDVDASTVINSITLRNGGSMEISNNTFTIANVIVQEGGFVQVSNTGTLNITGTLTIEEGATFKHSAGTWTSGTTVIDQLSTFEYNGGNQNIANLDYGHLKISGTGTKEITGTPATPTTCNKLNIETGTVLNISEGKAITVAGVITNVDGNSALVVKSSTTGDGSLIHNSSNAPATVQRFLKLDSGTEQYHYVSPAVQNQPVSLLSQAYYYDESTNDYWSGTTYEGEMGWKIPSGNLNPGTGYSNLSAEHTIDFTGNLNYSAAGYNISVPYTNHGSGNATNGVPYPNLDGWALVGNPYPCALDWANISKLNIDATVYYYDDTEDNYKYYNTDESHIINGGISVNGGSQYIPSGQGFFVKTSNTLSGGSVNIVNSARVHNTQTFWKETKIPNDYIKLRVDANEFYDETVIIFTDNATELYDGNYDAYKRFSPNGNVPQIYSHNPEINTEFAISALSPVNEAETIVTLGFSLQTTGTYTINATDLNFNNSSLHVYLYDLEEDVITDLNNTPSYTFNHTQGVVNNRFVLKFEQNDAPIIANQISDIHTLEDDYFEFTFAENVFTDANGDELTYTAKTPNWLSFNPITRTFSGTPENKDVAIVEISIIASDLFERSVECNFNIEVENTNDAPVLINPISDFHINTEEEFVFYIPTNTFWEQDLLDNLTYSIHHPENQAEWLSFNAMQNKLYGTPSSNQAGIYTIQLIAEDNNNAIVSDFFNINVKGTNNVENIDEQKISIYPNPTNGMFSIDISKHQNIKTSKIEITDVTGKTIQQFNNTTVQQFNNSKFDLSRYGSGIYFIEIKFDEKTYIEKLFVY